jgi:hypothetical protein
MDPSRLGIYVYSFSDIKIDETGWAKIQLSFFD